MTDFKPGDRVYVTDPGLADLRAIMRRGGYVPFPNHHGTVHEIWTNDRILITFDNEDGPAQGTGGLYPASEVRHLTPNAWPSLDVDRVEADAALPDGREPRAVEIRWTTDELHEMWEHNILTHRIITSDEADARRQLAAAFLEPGTPAHVIRILTVTPLARH